MTFSCSPGDNTIRIPIAYAQGNNFNLSLPMYFNFGGIGAVIGHELTHGFDNTGRKYDEDGKHLFYTFQTISYNANHYYIYIYIYIYIYLCVCIVSLYF